MPARTRSSSPNLADDSSSNTVPRATPKRPKAEENVVPRVAGQLDVGERDESLWFEEGDVVLAARGRAFKVHSGVLALHSAVLRALVTMPALAALPERLDGCPVLRVDDRGDALARLLGAIYLGGKSDWFRWGQYEHDRAPIDFQELFDVSRLAAKYEIQAVLEESRERLAAYYPSDTLLHWHAVQFTGEEDPHYRYLRHLRITRGDSLAAVSLLGVLGLPTGRPTALYECCRRDQNALLRGVRVGEETVRLSEDDVLLCLAARRRLIQENTRIFHALFVGFSDGGQPGECTTHGPCRAAVARLARQAVEQDVVGQADPFDGWYDVVTSSTAEGAKPKLCDICEDVLAEIVTEHARAIWDKLGEIFHVHPWPS